MQNHFIHIDPGATFETAQSVWDGRQMDKRRSDERTPRHVGKAKMHQVSRL